MLAGDFSVRYCILQHAVNKAVEVVFPLHDQIMSADLQFVK